MHLTWGQRHMESSAAPRAHPPSSFSCPSVLTWDPEQEAGDEQATSCSEV